jgi:protein-disulfide isomerase
VLLCVAVAGVLAAIISLSVGEGGPQAERIGDVGPVQQLFGGIAQEGARLGDPDAEVTISVFTDLRCAPCADYQIETIDPLVEELARTGEAQFALRHYSLGSESMTLAAEGAVAAGAQGRQWQFADLLMRNLGAAGAEVDDEFLADIASSLGQLDADEWRADRSSPAVAETLANDDEEGAALELQGDGASLLVTGPGGTEDLGVEPSREEIQAAVAAVAG